MPDEQPNLRDHPAAFAAWVVAAASVLASGTAVSLGWNQRIEWDTALYPLMFAVPGALIASRKPRDPIGWLMLFIAAEFAASTVAGQWLNTGNPFAASWWAWWAGRGGAMLLVPATVLLLFLLPDGRLPTPRWRAVAAGATGMQLAVIVVACFTRGPAALDDSVRGDGGLQNPLGFLPESWNEPLTALVPAAMTLPFLLVIPAVISRLRHADVDERPRVAGLLASVVLFALLVTIPDAAWPEAATGFHIVAATILTGAILLAVMRGVFETMEVALARALIYGSLTVIVAAVYLAAVVLVTSVGAPQRFAGAIAGIAALALLPARSLAQSALRWVIYGPQRPAAQGPSHARVDQPATLTELSRRENEIMQHLAQGMTNAEIAAQLFISPITVRNHVSSILTKLDATNRTQAVARFNKGQRVD